eukprot:GHVN01104774.1.p1 GENE.GHVN01104774.1~~GHVN01104774.1.p1  ORF type:complete len:511 (+),score=116.19 GHVN01104774.1:101-1633(+)
MDSPQPSILIVGAGPVGLTAALELHRRGMKADIIDARTGPIKECESRALGIHSKTLVMLKESGVSDELIARGHLITRMRLMVDDVSLIEADLNNSEQEYKFALGLRQSITESVLRSKLVKDYGCDVKWGVRLSSLKFVNEDKTRVEVKLESVHEGDEGSKGTKWLAEMEVVGGTKEDKASKKRKRTSMTKEQSGSAPSTLRSRSMQSTNGVREYDIVIGCDGAHSSVRKLIGIPFIGDRYKVRRSSEVGKRRASDLSRLSSVDGDQEVAVEWHLTDIEFDEVISPQSAPLTTSTQSSLSPRSNSTDGTKTHATSLAQITRDTQTGSQWAFLPLGQDSARIVTNSIGGEEEFKQRLAQQVHVKRVLWRSDFNISYRIVTTFNIGNVFLAGDAAHLHSPVGGRGMNLGIEDACTLAYLIDTHQTERYHTMRHPVALHVVNSVDKLTQLVLLSQGPPSSLATLGWTLLKLCSRLVGAATSLPLVQRLILKRFIGDDSPWPEWVTKVPKMSTMF